MFWDFRPTVFNDLTRIAQMHFAAANFSQHELMVVCTNRDKIFSWLRITILFLIGWIFDDAGSLFLLARNDGVTFKNVFVSRRERK
jgi:hypothetical protein